MTRTTSPFGVADGTGYDLLDPSVMHQLDQLDIVSRKVLSGKLQGERRSKRKGQSIEFADYRQYVAGDDLRFIDWNLYARLDRLFLRLFLEEQDLTVALLLDVSQSMDYGDPNKLHYTRRLAAALGYISLTHFNRLSCFAFSRTLSDQVTGLRGRKPLPQFLRFLQTLEPAGSGHLEQAVKLFALAQRTPCVVIVVSDFLDKGEVDQAMRWLAGNRFDAYAIQVLSPQEVDPVKGNLSGDLSLVDVEDQNLAEVSMSPGLIRQYKATVQAYCQQVHDQCVRRGVSHMITQTSVPFSDVVLRYLRQRGLLQ